MLNKGKFNKILNKQISNLNFKRCCFKNSINFDEFKNYRTKLSNIQNKKFDKLAKQH